MSTPSPSPNLRQALLSIARTQLLAQSQLAITYDAQALGTMAFDAGLGAIVVSAKSHAYLWIGSLALLVGSVACALLALLTTGAGETGPDVQGVLESRGAWDDEALETQIIEDLHVNLLANDRNLDAKVARVQFALTLVVLALACELAGQLL